MSPSYSHHPGTERPKLRTRPMPRLVCEPRMVAKSPKGDAHFNRPPMEETRMAELIVAFWQGKGFPLIEAHAEPNGIIRSNVGRNVYPPKD